jgi:hypothetical protein
MQNKFYSKGTFGREIFLIFRVNLQPMHYKRYNEYKKDVINKIKVFPYFKGEHFGPVCGTAIF